MGLVLVLPFLAVGCTSNSVDDGDSANVLLEVVDVQNPPITGSVETGSCTVSGNVCLTIADCDPQNFPGDQCQFDPGGEGCQITEWSANLANVPKSESAALGDPFNDIVVESVEVVYAWDSGFVNGPVTFPVAATIPVNATAAVTFFPMTNADLAALGAFLPPATATTAFVTMTFRGKAIDGESVSVTGADQLFVEACF
jgi:hypothetical protein